MVKVLVEAKMTKVAFEKGQLVNRQYDEDTIYYIKSINVGGVFDGMLECVKCSPPFESERLSPEDCRPFNGVVTITS